MATFGWIVCLIIMVGFTCLSVLVAAFSLSKFTIGGALQSNADRVFAVLLLALSCAGWWWVLALAPFTINFK